MASGLSVTMIEAPLDLQRNLKVPANHYDACKAGNVATAGNAAGNTVDVLDLSGANKSPDPLPVGFTAKGIVALVFSVIAAFLGMAVIAWYGAAPLGTATQTAAEHMVAEADMRDEGVTPVATTTGAAKA